MAFFKKALGKFTRGLQRTRAKLVNSLRSLLTGRALDAETLDKLESMLIQADMGVATAVRIRADIEAAARAGTIAGGDQVLEFLKADLKKYWPADDRLVHLADQPPTVIMVAGINGCGKTTSVAKLAWLYQSQGRKVCLAAADTFRAAAVEQLSIWADRIGCDIVKGSGKDPASVVYDACDAAKARGHDVLLVDTAGRLHTQDNLMRELTKIRDVVARKIPGAPHEVLLVLDATTGQNAISQAKAFTEAINVTGIFLAKLDGTAKGGIVVAIRNEVNLPVKFVGLGETFEDVEPFDPETFVEALFS
jgi:fused signal recognition particle receptor